MNQCREVTEAVGRIYFYNIERFQVKVNSLWLFSLTFNDKIRKLLHNFVKISQKLGYNTMFVVVDVAGQQLKVSPSERIFVPKLKEEIGDIVKFDHVMLYVDDSNVKIGNPFIKDISVEAKILGHHKDEKVIVFKKKRRKGYRVRKGHRQQYTQIEITKIS